MNGNPFFVKSADHSNAFGQLSQGMSNLQQQQQAKEQQAQQQQMTTDIQEAVNSGDLNRIADMSIQYPQMAQNIKAAVGFKNEATEGNFKDTAFKILSDPENTEQYLNERAEVVKAQGGDPTQTLKEIEVFRNDPKRFLQTTEGVAASMYGQDYKNWYESMNRADPNTPKPMTEYQTEMVRQKDAEMVIRSAELENKKLESQLKRETDALKKQELEEKIANNKQKVEIAKKEKIEGAQDSYLSSMDTLKLISDIESHPGFSDYVGAKGASSAFGLFDTPIGGTDASAVAGMVNTLSSQNFLNSVSQMKGMGALSENEGKKLADAVSSLDPNMPESDFKKSLNVIRNITKRGIDKSKRIMQKEGVDIPSLDGSESTATKTVSWGDL